MIDNLAQGVFNLVALRKESVDRNVNLRVLDGSKSVALRKESVDRKVVLEKIGTSRTESLSARRAWIEMNRTCSPCAPRSVALRKESVDRNYADNLTGRQLLGRSPQGERG